MSEQKETIVQIQAKRKPKIEEIISECLDGKAKKSILKFLDICKSNGIKTPWSATNRWVLKLNKQTIGMIYIGVKPCADVKKGLEKNTWYSFINSASRFLHNELKRDDIDVSEKEDIMYVIHRNLSKCAGDKKRCSPIKSIAIFGKEFDESDNLCSGCGGFDYNIHFVNSDDKTLYWINKIFEHTINQ